MDEYNQAQGMSWTVFEMTNQREMELGMKEETRAFWLVGESEREKKKLQSN